MMDRWWASRGAAETVALLMDRSDDPSMLVGTGFLVLHAIGAEAIEQQAGPFGDRSISKALDGIGDDPLIGAVCLAFDYASGIPGYGATRVAQLKAEADAGARAVYGSLVLQGPVELALKRAADTYGIAPSTVPTISKSLVSADFASESASDRALHARAALIADAESSEVSKLTRDTFEVRGHRRTQNRDSSGRFADTEGGRQPMTLQEKQRLRQERLGRYMQGARRRKEDAPERTADRERTVSRAQETVAEQAVQEQVQEQAVQEQAVQSEEEAARQRRRKKMVAARRAAAAAGSRRMAAGASSAGRYDAEIQGQARLEAARSAQQVVAQRIANKEKVRAAEQEKQEHHLAEVNAEKAKVLHAQHEEYKKKAKQVEKLKKNFAFFNPSDPKNTTQHTVIDLGPEYGRYVVPVPMALVEDLLRAESDYNELTAAGVFTDREAAAAHARMNRLVDNRHIVNLYAGRYVLDTRPFSADAADAVPKAAYDSGSDGTLRTVTFPAEDAAPTVAMVIAARGPTSGRTNYDMTELFAEYTKGRAWSSERPSALDDVYRSDMDFIVKAVDLYMQDSHEGELRRYYTEPTVAGLVDERNRRRSIGELVMDINEKTAVFSEGKRIVIPDDEAAEGVEKYNFAEFISEVYGAVDDNPDWGVPLYPIEAFIRAGQIRALTVSGTKQDEPKTGLTWKPAISGKVVVNYYDENGNYRTHAIEQVGLPLGTDVEDEIANVALPREIAGLRFVPDEKQTMKGEYVAEPIDMVDHPTSVTGFDKDKFLATFTPKHGWVQAVPLLPLGVSSATPGTAGGAHRQKAGDSPTSGVVYGDEHIVGVKSIYNEHIIDGTGDIDNTGGVHFGVEDPGFYYAFKKKVEESLDEALAAKKPEEG